MERDGIIGIMLIHMIMQQPKTVYCYSGIILKLLLICCGCLDKRMIIKERIYNQKKKLLYSEIEIDTQKRLNAICKKYSYTPNILTSILYLVIDCSYAVLVILLTLLLKEYLTPTILFVGYSIVMGTVMTGLWVLGYECGHGAFGRNIFENDFFGFILHSSLLVPYFSWKYSHNKHHKYTNHLILGETHVPMTKKVGKLLERIYNSFGEDAFSIFNIIIHLFFGWPAYLFNNDTGGRVMSYLKTRINKHKFKDHFYSNSQVMPKSLGWKVEISTMGCLSTLYCSKWLVSSLYLVTIYTSRCATL